MEFRKCVPACVCAKKRGIYISTLAPISLPPSIFLTMHEYEYNHFMSHIHFYLFLFFVFCSKIRIRRISKLNELKKGNKNIVTMLICLSFVCVCVCVSFAFFFFFCMYFIVAFCRPMLLSKCYTSTFIRSSTKYN